MKYGIMQAAMWTVFSPYYKRALKNVLDETEPPKVMKTAKRKYREILKDIPPFDKESPFLFNILSSASLCAILLSVKKDYELEEVRSFYRTAMDNFIIRSFAKGSKSYTKKGREKLKKAAEHSIRGTNPYDWKFRIDDGETINQYTATFLTCGICTLMNKLSLGRYIDAMCTFDYDMAAMNNTEFSRKYTIASGGEYCDCHYNHKAK